MGFTNGGTQQLGGLFHFCEAVFFEGHRVGLNTWKNADIWQAPSVVSVSDVCTDDANISMKSPSCASKTLACFVKRSEEVPCATKYRLVLDEMHNFSAI